MGPICAGDAGMTNTSNAFGSDLRVANREIDASFACIQNQ